MLLFYSSEKLWNDMLAFLRTTDLPKAYRFPDQDFLADFF
jgi:hypothetical protein